jgi:DnaJ-domain-containing protein 1
MGSFEVFAAIVFFILGYIIVSAVWPKRSAERADSGSAAVDAHLDAANGTSTAWHEVLGVSPDATAEDIRQAYSLQMSKYHPDKVAELGPEIQRVAQQMTQRLHVAYEQALKSRQ